MNTYYRTAFLATFFAVVRCSTITVDVGKDLTIKWNIPPKAINLFIYIGEAQNAQILATISKGGLTYDNKILAEKFEHRLAVEPSTKELKLRIFGTKHKDEGVYTATAQFGIVKSEILKAYHVEVKVTPTQRQSVFLGTGLTSSDTGIIIGIVVAIVVLSVILILIRYCYDRNSNLSTHLTNVQDDKETEL